MDNEHYQAAWGFEILKYINRLSKEFTEKYPEIDWSGIIGMKIIHDHHY